MARMTFQIIIIIIKIKYLLRGATNTLNVCKALSVNCFTVKEGRIHDYRKNMQNIVVFF